MLIIKYCSYEWKITTNYLLNNALELRHRLFKKTLSKDNEKLSFLKIVTRRTKKKYFLSNIT